MFRQLFQAVVKVTHKIDRKELLLPMDWCSVEVLKLLFGSIGFEPRKFLRAVTAF
jgi:hypothetical protein